MKTFTHSIPGPRTPLWKRALDIGLILLALPLLVPLTLATCAIIRLVSNGPVLFKQERIGRGGEKFMCFKFRTMFTGTNSASHEGHLRHLIESNVPMTKLDTGGDKRIIPFGVFLRATGMDELPQLINVVLGDMSIVGPRPCLPYEFQYYNPEQYERFSVVPGLTGLWQVSGKNRTTFKEMIQLDIEYSRRRSLAMDVRIIFKTVPTLLGQVMDSQDKKTDPKALPVREEGMLSTRVANH
ncbi:MAG TPA: sugar transferase [Verrucomicrobiae bacterium]|jgi:lipopolysaccharide/colanic/teichoic acid biosynthesis glycosyltransferase|nr:sugar transferase [Verrucomicrobiae bacterium]